MAISGTWPWLVVYPNKGSELVVVEDLRIAPPPSSYPESKLFGAKKIRRERFEKLIPADKCEMVFNHY